MLIYAYTFKSCIFRSKLYVHAIIHITIAANIDYLVFVCKDKGWGYVWSKSVVIALTPLVAHDQRESQDWWSIVFVAAREQLCGLWKADWIAPAIMSHSLVKYIGLHATYIIRANIWTTHWSNRDPKRYIFGDLDQDPYHNPAWHFIKAIL